MLVKFKNGTFGRSLGLLNAKEQRKVIAVVLIQVSLGFLDLIAVAIVGVLGALAVNGVQSRGPGNHVTSFLKAIGLYEMDFRAQVAILGTGAAAILIIRTIFSVFFSRKILYFLSFKSSSISSNLFARTIQEPLLSIRSKSSQELLFALTSGVTTITMGILGTAAIIISDLSLLVVMTVGLFVIDPILAISTLLIFGAISGVLFKYLNKRAQSLGQKNTILQVEGNSKILEVLSSYREIVVTHRRANYSEIVSDNRYALSESTAELAFMPNISKYVIESAVVLGALAISAVQFLLNDAAHAVATLSVFLAAGTRIAPAVMRIQQGAVSMKGSIGAATPTLNLVDELINQREAIGIPQELVIEHKGFVPEVLVKNVSLCYPSSDTQALDSISIRIEPGAFVAFVGPSGAGKTSLVDVILGIMKPSSGEVQLSQMDPLAAFEKWPGAVGYLPQDIEIIHGSVRDNLCLGLDPAKVDSALLWRALEAAHLSELVHSLPQGLDAPMGERGMNISGGQRQRLGIARALLSNPQLIVFDEATSALDGETESKVTESLLALKGKATVVMIAHRLSTIREADVIYYMESGKVVASGNFNELKKAFPRFDEQAQLMGL